MQSNLGIENLENDEIEYAKLLKKGGILSGPQKCSCGNKSFYIQIDNSNKTSKCYLR